MSQFVVYIVLSFVIACLCLVGIYAALALILRVSEVRQLRQLGPAPESRTSLRGPPLIQIPDVRPPKSTQEWLDSLQDALSRDSLETFSVIVASLGHLVMGTQAGLLEPDTSFALQALNRMDVTIAAARFRAPDDWSKYRRCLFQILSIPRLRLPAFEQLVRLLSQDDIVGAVREVLSSAECDIAAIVEVLNRYYTKVASQRILADTLLHIAVYHPGYEAAFGHIYKFDPILVDECSRRASALEKARLTVMQHRVVPMDAKALSRSIPMPPEDASSE